MSDLPMMPWWPKDYISATRAMRIAERGLYTDLLFFQWELGVLPGDTSTLARMVGVTPEEFDDVWPAIQDKFVKCEGGFINLVLETHREKALAKRNKHRAGALKTNAKRWSAESLSDTPSDAHIQSSLSDTLSGSPPSPSPYIKPTTDDQERSSEGNGVKKTIQKSWPKDWTRAKEGNFMLFKDEYPKRGGNQPCARARRAINARLKEGVKWSDILAGAERYAHFCEKTGKVGTETVMQAATFVGRDTEGYAQPWTIPAKQQLTLAQANRICIREAQARMVDESEEAFIMRMGLYG